MKNVIRRDKALTLQELITTLQELECEYELDLVNVEIHGNESGLVLELVESTLTDNSTVLDLEISPIKSAAY